MRKIYTLASALLVSSLALAQTAVTFKVNMNNQTVSSNGVHVAGNFDANGSSGTAWDPSAYQLTDPDMDGIYETTINLNEGMYEFKFINDNNWGAGEESIPAGAQVGGGNSNRWAYVSGSAQDVGSICFGEVVDCGKVGVTLQVNMSSETVSQYGLHVAGSFQGWTPDGTDMHSPDNSPIYKHIVELNPGDSMEFKFVNGDLWGDDETVPAACAQNGNRYFNDVQADTMMMAVCYGACDECSSSNVTFTVDMSNETNIDPAGVFIAGTFNGWTDGALTDNSDGTWSVTLPLQQQLHKYKFKNGPNGWESLSDREVNITSNDTAVTYCFNTTSASCPLWPDSSMVTFTVDVSAMTGSIDPSQDSGGVYIMGGFTDPQWQSGAIKMDQVGSTDQYATTIKLGGNTDIFFKYVINKPGTSIAVEESADFTEIGGCGVDNGGGFTDNRYFVRSANDTTVCWTFDACDVCGTTSVTEMSAVDFGVNVFPNPFDNTATIQFKQADNYTVSLTDLTGKTVYSTVSNGSNTHIIHAENLNAGMYILSVTDSNNNFSTSRVIVQ